MHQRMQIINLNRKNDNKKVHCHQPIKLSKSFVADVSETFHYIYSFHHKVYWIFFLFSVTLYSPYLLIISTESCYIISQQKTLGAERERGLGRAQMLMLTLHISTVGYLSKDWRQYVTLYCIIGSKTTRILLRLLNYYFTDYHCQLLPFHAW